MQTIATTITEHIFLQGEEKGLKEGELKGELKGQLKAWYESILDTLEARFDTVSAALTKQLRKIDDLTALKQLQREAVRSESLAAFQQKLTKILSKPARNRG